MTFKYESSKTLNIPSEIWRFGDESVTKVFQPQHKVVTFQLKPYLETVDVDTTYDLCQRKEAQASRFDLFQGKRKDKRENVMQQLKTEKRKKDRS